MGVWGWSDTRCSGAHPFMCRSARGWRRSQALGGAGCSPRQQCAEAAEVRSPCMRTAMTAPRCPLRHAAPVATPPYTSSLSGATFYLNTTASTFEAAQAACNANGGHLASYGTTAEQLEVEQWFIKQGYLLPAFHRCTANPAALLAAQAVPVP
jgi:hypothetical protein